MQSEIFRRWNAKYQTSEISRITDTWHSWFEKRDWFYKDGFTRHRGVLRQSGNGELRADVISDIVPRQIGFGQSELRLYNGGRSLRRKGAVKL